MPAFASVDGRVLPAHEARVSVFDNGFAFGDSVYETLRTYGGQAFAVDRHLRRLRRSAQRLQIDLPLTDAVFRACPGLKMISIWGTGTDNVDLAAAARRGITVCSTPGVNAYAVAEHAIALMLALARGIPRIDRDRKSVV